jgi:predicted aldo/keto reductase-like oxidoreductase
MLYNKIGNEKVSALGFGCMRFPMEDGKVDLAQTRRMIETAYNAGVNYFDTAYVYHDEKSEEITAEILRQYPRESYYIADKLPTWFGMTVPDCKKMFETSLARLKTDYIDFYLLHSLHRDRFDILVENGVVDWLLTEKEAGRIKYLGFSFHDSYRSFSHILSYRQWDFCQIQLNYIDTDFQAGSQGLADAAARGIPVVVMEPVKGSALASFPDEMMAEYRAVNPNDSAARWALRFAASQAGVAVTLSGMSNEEQVADNLETFRDFKPLSDVETAVLSKQVEKIKSRVFNPCTGCAYCMPCPAGVNIPKIFAAYNHYGMFKDPGKLRWDIKNDTAKSELPENCIKCGKCETHCPQGIKIRTELENARKLFGEVLG